jgi:hypothetical protein
MNPTVITNHIRKYASAQILQKGKSIFHRKRFSIINFDMENDVFLYNVRSDEGIQTYEVALSATNGKINCTCTCPYTDDLCKHSIAVLIDIRQKQVLRSDKFQAKEAEEYNQQNTTINIKEGISEGLLNRLINNNSRKKAKGFSLISHKSVGEFIEAEKKISCTVKEGKRHFHLFFDRPGNNDLNTCCDCTEKDTPICSHKFAALYKKAVMQREPFFFDTLLNLDYQKNDLLAAYGYTIKDNLKNKFSFSSEYGRLTLHVEDASLQKISASNNWNNKLFHLINRETSFHMDSEAQDTKDADDVIAFAFYTNSGESGLSIIPLAGKYGKNAASGIKNIRPLNEVNIEDRPLLDDTTSQIIKLIGQISPEIVRKTAKKRFKNFSVKDPAHYYFMLDYTHEKINLINKELFSYPLFVTDSFYNIRKNDLMTVTLSEERLDMRFTLSEKQELLVLSTTFFVKGESNDSCLAINERILSATSDKKNLKRGPRVTRRFEGYEDNLEVNDFYYISQGKCIPTEQQIMP